jgi:5-methyltetrahydrofolate--homocysteine methyltransferase
MSDSLALIKQTIVDLNIDEIQNVVQKCLDEGIPAWDIIAKGLGPGMAEVGSLFESGEYYLADLVLSGEMMKEGMQMLGDLGEQAEAASKGTVVLATAKGDIHDIGKNIVSTMLSAGGFKVMDLGVDCHEDKIIEAVKSSGSSMIGLSVLLTTMIGSIKDLVEGLNREGLRDKVKIAIGGACCSQDLANEMKVDALGEDAVKAVKIFDQFV